MLSAVIGKDTGKLVEYQRLMKKPKYRQFYRNSYAKVKGRIVQGMPGLAEGTNTMFFVDKKAIPPDIWRDVTYGRVVVDYRPENTDPYLTRLSVGGDRVNYPGGCRIPPVYLNVVKLLLNSIVLTLNAKFMTIDVKYFYSNTPMD